MIEVEHLTKRFGRLLAVDDISFAVGQGEVVGFLGPNGAGKTTVMRILTAFMPPTSGSVRVAGFDPFWDSVQVRRRVGYLAENVPLYPEMRVGEFLFFRARLKGVPACERRRRVGEVVDRCGIGEVRRRLIGHLSRGYHQRVGLADALLGDPPILILDEPTVGLDPNQVRLVREMIRELGQRRTVLLSTHILSEVELICPRVIVISGGRIVAQGRTEELTRGLQAGQRLRVAARGPAQAVRRALEALPGVQGVAAQEAEAGACAFAVEGAEDAPLGESVVARLQEGGWPLLELSPQAPTLEDLFVSLTRTEDVVGGGG
ncbi:MAG: ABC transporter ATP-binding protein [Candidatus Brocadiia bacterium]